MSIRPMIQRVITNAMNEGADITWAPHYCEPGYSCDEDGVFFANWNPRSFNPPVPSTESRIGALLEKIDASMEWSDEWTTCNECNGAVRTQPDSYSWRPSYVLVDECEIVCHDCLDIETQEARIINDPDLADTLDFDWASRGWRRAETHETGFHSGQDGDPSAVCNRLGAEHDVLFTIDSKGQFDTRWSAWVRDPG